MMKFANQPESVLSATEAVSDFGFLTALGPHNVLAGAAIHKFIIKNALNPSLSSDPNDSLKNCFANAIKLYPNGDLGEFDVLKTFRKIFLHASISSFVDPSILTIYPEFIDDFMRFQDRLEDAVAKAVILPHWVADPLILRPVEKLRLPMVRKLGEAIQTVWDKDGGSLWLRHLKTIPRPKKWVGLWGGKNDGKEALTSEEAAEVIIGLLFASHKNPSIAASQTLLFMMERKGCVERAISDQKFLENCTIEALRLTAHAIGAVRKVIAKDGWVLGDITLKRGEYVGVSHILPHRNTEIYPDAKTFNPDRYDKNPELLKNPYKFTTFSHGIHACPGKTWTLKAIPCFLNIFLNQFELEKAKVAFPPLSFKRATLAQRERP
eukprot:UC4_evm1s956